MITVNESRKILILRDSQFAIIPKKYTEYGVFNAFQNFSEFLAFCPHTAHKFGLFPRCFPGIEGGILSAVRVRHPSGVRPGVLAVIGGGRRSGTVPEQFRSRSVARLVGHDKYGEIGKAIKVCFARGASGWPVLHFERA